MRLDGAEATLAQIETPYLQMVMTRLWEQEEKAGSHILRLATFVEDPPTGLGGADLIVRSHLDGEMESLDPSERDVAAQASDFWSRALAAKSRWRWTISPVIHLCPPKSWRRCSTS